METYSLRNHHLLKIPPVRHGARFFHRPPRTFLANCLLVSDQSLILNPLENDDDQSQTRKVQRLNPQSNSLVGPLHPVED